MADNRYLAGDIVVVVGGRGEGGGPGDNRYLAGIMVVEVGGGEGRGGEGGGGHIT